MRRITKGGGAGKGEEGKGEEGKGEAGKSKGAGRTAEAARDARWDEQVDGLFQLPLADFTAARNALAGRLRKGGHAEEAERVKSLPKPGVPAWAVNQIYWQHRGDFDKLMAAGAEFRKAQAAQLDGKATDIRAPLDARREILSKLTRLADNLLRRAEHTATPDTMRRITTTLEALSTYGDHPGVPRAGRLVDDVEPPGFEALAALVPRVGKSSRDEAEPTRVLPFRQQTRRSKPARRKSSNPEEEQRRLEEDRRARTAAAKAAVAAAERVLRDARKAAERAEAALKQTAARVKDAEKARADLEKKLELVAAEATTAKQRARAVAVEAEEAAQAVADAERSLQKATDDLKSI
jgi:hypothetical protein